MATDEQRYPRIGMARDEEIINLVVRKGWVQLSAFYRPYIRQVQDNLRMIAGRHWDLWIESQGQFVDVSKWMDDRERKWRQRPVFNWIGYWYMVTVAKMTENEPIVATLPATPDRMDSLLAQVFDPIYKYIWDVSHMSEKVDQLVRWMVGGGECVLKSDWDPDAGAVFDLVAPAMVPVLDEMGQPMITRDGELLQQYVEQAPYQFDEETGEPVPMVIPTPGGGYEIDGKPAQVPEGQINPRVINPLSIRTSQEPDKLFHEKQSYTERSVMHVDEIYARFGKRVEPEKDVGPDSTIDELLFGLGDVGASQHAYPGQITSDRAKEGFATVYERWERPREGAENGRKTICTATELLDDDENPYDPYFIPYQSASFISLPHRKQGKSPAEDIAPINRTYDRGWGQILEHRNLMTNPKWVKDSLAGIKDITNQPGEVITALRRPGVPALEAVQPPQLPDVVYRIQEMLKMEMQDIGSLRSGSEGRSPTYEASGELVKELRFNDDRYVGPAAAGFVRMIARAVDSWQPLLKFGWDAERMIRVAGTANTARFLTVTPELFTGRVNVRPVIESMLPEGRGERQKRLDFWMSAGLISPETYFELYNHPHLGRAARPGGVDAEMAEQEHAQMLRGVLAIPIEPHDDMVHMAVHRVFMASPEFMELDMEVQAIFFQHVQYHEMQAFQKAVKEAQQLAITAELQPSLPGEDQGGGPAA